MWLESVARRKTESGQPYRFEYGEANRRWRKLLLRLVAQPVNVVITAQTTSAFDIDGRELPVKLPKIQKQTSHIADIELHLQKLFDPSKKGFVYRATIKKCRFQRGFEAEIEDVTYDKLVEVLKTKLGVEVTP
jgi:hypothetical protein